jgi:hypothetical protein
MIYRSEKYKKHKRQTRWSGICTQLELRNNCSEYMLCTPVPRKSDFCDSATQAPNGLASLGSGIPTALQKWMIKSAAPMTE